MLEHHIWLFSKKGEFKLLNLFLMKWLLASTILLVYVSATGVTRERRYPKWTILEGRQWKKLYDFHLPGLEVHLKRKSVTEKRGAKKEVGEGQTKKKKKEKRKGKKIKKNKK